MRRPNVVFIMADDMGYGDIGCFNDGLTETPVLDQLSEESICLSQHYSASCVCTPARAGFLTGRYPHRTGAIEMRSCRGLDRLASRETTIADLFRAEGYVTGLVGKWHTGVYGEAYHPNRRGFDEFLGFRGGCMDYWDYRIERNGTRIQPEGKYLTDVFSDEACGFIRNHQKEPFFLCLHYNAPHTPLQAPEADIASCIDPGRFTRGVSIVYAMMKAMDRGIGRVRQTLSELGLCDNTMLLFTSDNGPAMYGAGENCMSRFNCNMAGGKGNVYEGGIRVPMMIHWPDGGLGEGAVSDEFVHFTDWLPTLIRAAGGAVPPDLALDGTDMLSVIRNGSGSSPGPHFWQWNRYTPMAECNAAMRQGPWKLIRPLIKGSTWTSPEEMKLDRHYEMHPEDFKDILRTPEPQRNLDDPPPPELYHLADDPGEKNNLAEAESDRVHRMTRTLESWFESVEADRREISDDGYCV